MKPVMQQNTNKNNPESEAAIIAKANAHYDSLTDEEKAAFDAEHEAKAQAWEMNPDQLGVDTQEVIEGMNLNTKVQLNADNNYELMTDVNGAVKNIENNASLIHTLDTDANKIESNAENKLKQLGIDAAIDKKDVIAREMGDVIQNGHIDENTSDLTNALVAKEMIETVNSGTTAEKQELVDRVGVREARRLVSLAHTALHSAEGESTDFLEFAGRKLANPMLTQHEATPTDTDEAAEVAAELKLPDEELEDAA
jgi:hypothetical protein